jgi:hypothetical protein
MSDPDSKDIPDAAQPADEKTLLALMRDRADLLPDGEFEVVTAFLAELLDSGLPPLEARSLFGRVKLASGFPTSLIKEAWDRLRSEREARRRAQAAQRERALPEVFIQNQNKVLDRLTGTMSSVQAYLTVRAREFAGDKQAAEETYLVGAQALTEHVKDLTFDPALPTGVVTTPEGARLYNTYRPSLLVPRGNGRDEEVRPWLDLLRALSLEGGEEEERMLLDRLAWTVQHPGRKINHGVLIGGRKGIGKDSLLAPVLDAVGRHNVNVADGAELESGFNSYVAGAKLLVINEIDYGDHKDRRKIGEKLKRVLAAPPDELVVNEKHFRPYRIPNRLTVVGFTNHRYPLHADEDARRWLALWCDGSIPPEQQAAWDRWFDRYWAWLHDGGSSYVLGWLHARDVSQFSPGARPPHTEWMHEMVQNSRDGLESWLLEQIDTAKGIFEPNTVKVDDIMALLATGVGGHWLGGRPVNPHQVGRALRNIGAVPRAMGVRRQRYWIIREGDRQLGEARRAGVVQRIRLRKRAEGLPEDVPAWVR